MEATAQSNASFARRIRRLRSDIEEISTTLYNTNARDPHLRMLNLKTFRIELLRGSILYMHMALYDLLRELLVAHVSNHRKYIRANAVKKYVEDLRSAEVVAWCGRLNLVSEKQYKALVELNSVRNACAHNWILDIPKVRKSAKGSTGKRGREPVVKFNSQDLFDRSVFFEQFWPLYGGTYRRLLGKVWRLQGRI